MNDDELAREASDGSLDRLDELIALAALGELTAEQEAELDAALGDPTLGGELRGALDTAAVLQGEPVFDVPAGLRASVLEGIADVEQDEPPTERAATSTAGEPSADVVDITSRRRGRVAAVLAAAAAAMLVIGAGVVLVVMDDGGRDPIDAVVDADDTVIRELDGQLAGDLSVVHSPGERAIVVIGDGLDPVDPESTLQLWLVTENGATPVGTFRPDGAGRVEQRFDDVDPTGVVLGVTREPASGSRTPTLPILASA